MESHVEKIWGYEDIIVNNNRYCGKILTIKRGYRCSLQFHKKKHETFYILSGTLLIEYGDSVLEMKEGDILSIPPKTIHRFQPTTSEAKILEISTHHDDRDTVRLEPGGISDHVVL